jgi:hypothetical protein
VGDWGFAVPQWTRTACGWCNGFHDGPCPRVKSVEYHENGTVKRVEFHDPAPVYTIGLGHTSREN